MPNVYDILNNIYANLPNLFRFVTGGSVLIGFWFMLRAVYQLRMYGELRTMMASQTNIAGPLLFLIAGISLMYWPSLMQTMMSTVFAYTSPLSYTQDSSSETFNMAIKVCGGIIQFVGFIAFIRGWILLTGYGQQSSRGPVVGKGLAHILSGICAVNIYGSWAILKASLGIS